MALHHIACLDGPNTFGRAGKDQVPRAQGDEAREVLDDLRDTPDQMSDITLLAYFTVHLEPDRASLQITTHRGGNEGRARRGFVKALPHVPRPALLARAHLQVSACHIEAYGIPEDVPVRLLGRNRPAPLTDGHHQLDLVLEIVRHRRIGDVLTGGYERVRRLQEEEWLLAVR